MSRVPDDVAVRRLRENRKELWTEASAIAQRTWQANAAPALKDVRRFCGLMAMIEEIDRRIGKLRVTEDPVPLRVVMTDE